MENNEIYNAINQTLAILEHNFKYTYGKKISYEEIFEMMKDLYVLFTNFEENVQKCGELAIKRYIPLLDLLVSIDNNTNHLLEYNKQLKYAYKISARVSLEHYMVYREWEQPEKEKLFETRYNILIGYIHYLQELECNPHFLTLVFNCPSGYGKTYPKKISEAWSFGIDDKGAFLSLCSNDDVVKSGSRAVIDEMKSDEFGEVFPKLKWNEENKDYFLKETDEKWKLKNCRLPFSYYAKTTQSNVVGSRASKSIHIDDLYPDFKEAMNQVLNKYYYDKSITVWEKRYVQNKPPKVCITGTLWASGDYIDQKIQQLEREHKFKPHPKYPYTRISEDGSCAIIQVPALDYETGESTCPELKSTQELLKEKNNMEEYLWETNFQQIPTNPESLGFSYEKLRTYKTIPQTFEFDYFVEIRYENEDEFTLFIAHLVNDKYLTQEDILTAIKNRKEIYMNIENSLRQFKLLKMASVHQTINCKIELIWDILRNMKMIHKYNHLLADQVEYNGNKLTNGKIIKLIKKNNNNKKSVEIIAKVKNCSIKKTKIEKEFNIQISVSKDKNFMHFYTIKKIIITVYEYEEKCSIYILFFFKDILTRDKFSIFNKEKNNELMKFKNIIENYNKTRGDAIEIL